MGGYSVPSGDGTLDKISAYCKGSSKTCQCAIYDSTWINTADYVGETVTGTTSSSYSWIDMNANGTINVTNGEDYDLVFNANGLYYIKYDSGSHNGIQHSSTFGTWPDPVTWTQFFGKQTYSIYATYTESTSELTEENKTSNYTILNTECDGTKVFTNTGATQDVTFTLPSLENGLEVYIANTKYNFNNEIKIKSSNIDKIDAVGTINTEYGTCVKFTCDGTKWTAQQVTL